MVKEAFNRKTAFLTCKLNIELRKKLVRFISVTFHFIAQRAGHEENSSGVFVGCRNVVLEENGEDKMMKRSADEEVLERIGEMRIFLHIL
jgi:hypothetical protein